MSTNVVSTCGSIRSLAGLTRATPVVFAGSGRSKRIAKRDAAFKMLMMLKQGTTLPSSPRPVSGEEEEEEEREASLVSIALPHCTMYFYCSRMEIHWAYVFVGVVCQLGYVR